MVEQKEIEIIGGIIITPLLKAQKSLERALAETKTELNRDGTIQRFEYTFELAWKTLKRVLAYKGIRDSNPRDVFRDAAREGFIDNPEKWFEHLDNWNRTSHVYKEDVAEEIFHTLPGFNDDLTKMIDVIMKLK